MSTEAITAESVTAEAIAAHTAKFAVAPVAAPVTETDYQKLYEQKVEENDRLSAVIAASRIATSTPANKSHRPAITAARMRALVGDAAYLNMSRTEKLVALGVDPASASDDLLRRAFGRGAAGSVGADLHKTSPARYSLLREAALALNIYGN
jgi:hypothetical protein